jgi:DNA-binding transcriptional LysR family regulator
MTSPPSRALDAERIELRLLRYFLAVMEELHFGRAAQRLHMSQPPVSQAVRKLEEQLGVDLLERTSRGVVPTEAGRAFAKEARRVLTGVDIAIAEARRAGGADSALRIGSVLHFPLPPLYRFVRALEEGGLTADPQVMRLPSSEQVRRLRSGELELGTFPLAEKHAGLETEPLFRGELLAAYVCRENPLAANEVLEPDDLREQPIYVFQRANPALWDRSLERFKAAGYAFGDLRDVPGNDGRDALLSLVGGSGVALLPASILGTSQAERLVVRVPLVPSVSLPDTVLAWSASPPRQLGDILGEVRSVARRVHAGCSMPLTH